MFVNFFFASLFLFSAGPFTVTLAHLPSLGMANRASLSQEPNFHSSLGISGKAGILASVTVG